MFIKCRQAHWQTVGGTWMVYLALWIPQISHVYLFIVFNVWLLFLNTVLASTYQSWKVRSRCVSWCASLVCSCFLPILQAASDRLPGKSVENCPPSRCTGEETGTRKCSSSPFQHYHGHRLFGSAHGLHPRPFSSTTCTWHNVFLTSLTFFQLFSSTQSQSYFKAPVQMTPWSLGSYRKLQSGLYILLFRTSNQINSYFITYSDDYILFDLFFFK